MKSPIFLQPLYKTRVWGGRSLANVYGRELPGDDSMPVGESWDVVDRPETQSVVIGGQYVGQTLGELWREKREEIFGQNAPDRERFPLLCKILDVQQNLSVQVHPSPEAAKKLGGEQKSEYWYAAKTEADALWYVGLKSGVTQVIFEKHVENGTTPECLNQLSICDGNAMYVPSGLVHALGAGQIIFEIQENSDTTYRIYDWDRSEVIGVKRALHIDEAILSIDFENTFHVGIENTEGQLLDCKQFQVQRFCLPNGEGLKLQPEVFSIIAVVSGDVVCGEASFQAGDYFLIPADAEKGLVSAISNSETTKETVLLQITWPNGESK